MALTTPLLGADFDQLPSSVESPVQPTVPVSDSFVLIITPQPTLQHAVIRYYVAPEPFSARRTHLTWV
jgi:hypothetical protein